jgi:PAS domain-containing protein
MPSASPLHTAFCGVWCFVVCGAAVYNSPSVPLSILPLSLPQMSAVAGPSSRPVQLQPSQPNVHPWEFTRRKRWADLLVTELSDGIVLVLSSRRKVLFCNPAVREILGWQDEDLIDSDFKDLVNGLYPTRSHRSLFPLLSATAPQRTTDSAFARHMLAPSSVVKSYNSMRGSSVNPTPSLTRQ